MNLLSAPRASPIRGYVAFIRDFVAFTRGYAAVLLLAIAGASLGRQNAGCMNATEEGAARSAAQRLPPGTVMALVAMGLGVLVIANDFTALNVALPVIEHDFNTDVSTVQWVVNAYALTFGMAIVTGGRPAGIVGPRRAFFVGSATFAGVSLVVACAPSAAPGHRVRV